MKGKQYLQCRGRKYVVILNRTDKEGLVRKPFEQRLKGNA